MKNKSLKISLYSDDFGYQPKVDNKILNLIKNNKLSGLSILSTMVSDKSLDLLKKTISRKKSKVLIGLHANLVEGKGLNDKIHDNKLCNANNNFYPLFIFLLKLLFKKISEKEIYQELDFQLKNLLAKGIKIDIIDSHEHTHAFSPVAEVVHKLARKHKLKIRSYNNINNYTYRSKATYLFIKLISFLSHIIYYNNLALPITWRLKDKTKWSILSWEGRGLDISKVKDKDVNFVIHPYLGFDKNSSYETFFID